MSEASSERRRAGSPNLREARLMLSRDGQTKVGLLGAWEVLRMECKDSTCREGEVREGFRGVDRVAIKEAIKELIKEVIVEDPNEAHRVMAIVVITIVTVRVEVTRTTTNSNPMGKEEGTRGGNLGLIGGRACIVWPNTGRTNSIILPV